LADLGIAVGHRATSGWAALEGKALESSSHWRAGAKPSRLSAVYDHCSCAHQRTVKSLRALIQDANGDLYGTTSAAGNVEGAGTVFKLSKTGNLTVLYTHTFCSHSGSTDGKAPYAGLIQDAKGNLYGTTPDGSDLSCGQGQGRGVVFKLTP
jgi:uncharacterized repeat protein (TIGR03803 family)